MWQKGSAHRIESVCAWEEGGCITRVPADVRLLMCVLSASSPQNSSEGWRTHTMRAPCERILCKGPASMAPLPRVSTRIWVKAMTLLVSGRSVEGPLYKRSFVVYQGQPPCDPKTLGVLLGQRREIDAWIRSREVQGALPQRGSVREPNRLCKPLFLNANGASPKFWCNI